MNYMKQVDNNFDMFQSAPISSMSNRITVINHIDITKKKPAAKE